MADILAEICEVKRIHVARTKTERSQGEVDIAARQAPPPRDFRQGLSDAIASGRYGLIAEIKKASPSQGLIRADFNPAALASAYQAGGASCLSVLTDAPYFQGTDEFLTAARTASELPVLRKDFMIEPYQVAEARALGADCILVILAALDDALAAELCATAVEWNMSVLLEVHNEDELARALKLPEASAMIGINNRDLKTLAVDIAVTERLAPLVPSDRLMVGESGIGNTDDAARLAEAGVNCFLVGESLMRQEDVTAATAALLSEGKATP